MLVRTLIRGCRRFYFSKFESYVRLHKLKRNGKFVGDHLKILKEFSPEAIPSYSIKDENEYAAHLAALIHPNEKLRVRKEKNKSISTKEETKIDH